MSSNRSSSRRERVPGRNSGHGRRQGEPRRESSRRSARGGKASSRQRRASGRNPSQGRRPGRQRVDGYGRDPEDDPDTRHLPPANDKPHPLVFIIPGAFVLLFFIVLVAGFGGGGSRRPRRRRSVAPPPPSRRRYVEEQRELTAGEKTLERGKAALARAQAMPIGPERNRAYREAAEIFARAREQLERSGLRAKAIEANSHRYSCMKYATDTAR